MRASDLQPDVALKALLENQVKGDKGVAQVYEYASQPNDVKADYFISLRNNGIVNMVTHNNGFFNGNIALRIFCRLYPDNTANVILSKRLARHCEDLVNHKISDGYFFKLDAMNPITDVNPNTISGYSEYALNVSWRTQASRI